MENYSVSFTILISSFLLSSTTSWKIVISFCQGCISIYGYGATMAIHLYGTIYGHICMVWYGHICIEIIALIIIELSEYILERYCV